MLKSMIALVLHSCTLDLSVNMNEQYTSFNLLASVLCPCFLNVVGFNKYPLFGY